MKDKDEMENNTGERKKSSCNDFKILWKRMVQLKKCSILYIVFTCRLLQWHQNISYGVKD